MKEINNKTEFYEGQVIKVVWEHDGLLQRHEGEIIIKMEDLGFSDDETWLVNILDRDDTKRMIQVWDDEMFEIKEVK